MRRAAFALQATLALGAARARAQDAGAPAPGAAVVIPNLPAQDAGAPAPGAAVVIPNLPAEEPVVRVALSSPEVGLGEVFYLFVAVDHAPGIEVDLPAGLALGPDLEETARTDRLGQNPAGGLTREFEIALMAFRVGDLAIPPIAVTWSIGGRSHDVRTAPIHVAVRGVIGEGEPTLRDIAPPVGVVRRDLRPVWIAAGGLGGLVAIAVVVAVVRARRRRRPGGVDAPGRAARPPHEEALARLAEVEGSGALDADDRKPVYLELSEILRDYLGRRFGFPALDLTTAEIRRRLAELPDPGDALGKVGDWLERCDVVKYARALATEDEARQALYDARIVVERTREAAAPAAPARAEEGAA